jgi:hypothetical protein
MERITEGIFARIVSYHLLLFLRVEVMVVPGSPWRQEGTGQLYLLKRN